MGAEIINDRDEFNQILKESIRTVMPVALLPKSKDFIHKKSIITHNNRSGEKK